MVCNDFVSMFLKDNLLLLFLKSISDTVLFFTTKQLDAYYEMGIRIQITNFHYVYYILNLNSNFLNIIIYSRFGSACFLKYWLFGNNINKGKMYFDPVSFILMLKLRKEILNFN